MARRHEINTKHNPDAGGRRRVKHNPVEAMKKESQQNDSVARLISKLKNNPTRLERYLKKISASWAELNFPQKVVVCIVLAVVAGGSAYFIFRVMMQANVTFKDDDSISSGFKYDSNRLTSHEQMLVNKKLKSLVALHPAVMGDISQKPKDRLSAAEMKFVEEWKAKTEVLRESLTITTKIHAKALSTWENFSIFASRFRGPNPYLANYSPKDKMVLVDQKSLTKPDKHEISAVFLNEMHSVAVHVRNQELGCPMRGDQQDAFPFCHDKKMSVAKLKLLSMAINAGFKKISQLFEFSEHRSKLKEPLNDTAEDFYLKAIAALNTFHPVVRTMQLSMAEYNRDIRPYLQHISSIGDGYSHVIDLSVAEKKGFYAFPLSMIGGTYVKVLEEHPYDGLFIRLQHGSDETDHDRVCALLNYLEVAVAMLKHPGSSYSKTAAKMESADFYRTTELASYIDELPVATKAFFFNEFCDYFSEYFEVEYCDHEDPPAFTGV